MAVFNKPLNIKAGCGLVFSLEAVSLVTPALLDKVQQHFCNNKRCSTLVLVIWKPPAIHGCQALEMWFTA